jgi:hypothetical protein
MNSRGDLTSPSNATRESISISPVRDTMEATNPIVVSELLPGGANLSGRLRVEDLVRLRMRQKEQLAPLQA